MLDRDARVVVAGAGGFIGGHMVRRLIHDGWRDVHAVDIKPVHSWYQFHPTAENFQADVSRAENARAVVAGARYVINLAADMGGIGFIENNKAACMLSVLSSTHLLVAAREVGCERFFFASSACVYPVSRQRPGYPPLTEASAYPAEPEDGYGWEKLFGERMCRHFYEDYGLETRVARYHNIYGPCFDDQTEVLTRDGWKLFAQIGFSDEIATLRPAAGSVEYHQPDAIQTYHYSGPMYRVCHRAADLLVTPDHSVYYSFRTSGPTGARRSPFRLAKASESGWDRATMYFTCAMPWRGLHDQEFFDLEAAHCTDGRHLNNKGGAAKAIPMNLWLRFVGWYLSEGSAWQTARNYTVCITQAPGPRQDEIVQLLTEMGFKPYTFGRNIRVESKQLYAAVVPLGQGAYRKVLPRCYLMLPPQRLSHLFAALMAGDGDEDGGRYSTVSRDLADAVMELALKLGKRAWVGVDGVMHRVHISDFTILDTDRTHRTIEHYEGRVYDVTVPNHILMVRRNGKAMWSGNCGTFDGGREKAPAAICRKVIQAKLSGSKEIEVWGDGEQQRSFTYIDDCIAGTLRILASDVRQPLNLGSDQMVTIDQLVDAVEEIADYRVQRRYVPDAPQGVRVRNSDNRLIGELLGWVPKITLAEGLEPTYRWIYDQMTGGR